MIQKARVLRLADGLAVIYLAVLLLLPFHALLTTWAGSSFGHIDVWRIWKELIIFATVPFVAWIAWHHQACREWLQNSWLPRLILCYMALTLGLGLVALETDRVTTQAVIYGLLANLRFVGFFLLVAVVATQSKLLRQYASLLVLVAGVAVVLFGLLQLTVLPYDFLKHFGYGADTIPAYHTVDNKLAYQRVQSTLRGPNPLGAYLVVIGTLILAYWRVRLPRMSWHLMLYGALLFGVLLFSYSRSAYIGILVSLLVPLVVSAKPRYRASMIIGSGILLLLLAVSFWAVRGSGTAQNALFHTDSSSSSVQSSNAVRTAALKSGLADVAREPLGRGPGTAGPASMRNTHPARIAENYFLQLGQEVGWLGLALFSAINAYVGYLLWTMRKNVLALALLGSLVGITIINLISHAWADDTLGLLWWGLAGVVVGPVILNEKKQHVGS